MILKLIGCTKEQGINTIFFQAVCIYFTFFSTFVW